MAELGLVRVDSRMIHGQITTAWNNLVHATTIIVIDDIVAGDPLLAKSLEFAAPVGTSVMAYTIDQAAEAWRKNQFGSGKVLVLFRDVKAAHAAWKKGFAYHTLNLGNIPSGPGRKVAFKTCYMSGDEAELLKEMEAGGMAISLRFMPQEKEVALKTLLQKAGF